MEPAVLDFVRRTPDVVLFCRDRNGRPIGWPMRTLTSSTAAVSFTTYRKSAKVRLLRLDPRVCLLVTETYGSTVRWVSMTGTARIVTPTPDAIADLFTTRAADSRVPPGMVALVKERLRDGKRVVVRVEGLDGGCSVNEVKAG